MAFQVSGNIDFHLLLLIFLEFKPCDHALWKNIKACVNIDCLWVTQKKLCDLCKGRKLFVFSGNPEGHEYKKEKSKKQEYRLTQKNTEKNTPNINERKEEYKR